MNNIFIKITFTNLILSWGKFKIQKFKNCTYIPKNVKIFKVSNWKFSLDVKSKGKCYLYTSFNKATKIYHQLGSILSSSYPLFSWKGWWIFLQQCLMYIIVYTSSCVKLWFDSFFKKIKISINHTFVNSNDVNNDV